ncbi:MAG TPA: hypothetical protein VFS43_16650 [Polyangiaceae bacterium]|nr:hypothetical protein [Polyangiaceae bacterium]
MIRVPPAELPPEAARSLADYQAAVDMFASYAERVVAAKERFAAANRKENPAFRAVRQTLDGMCHGPRRCMYCEDSAADEVEHVRPKDLYPEVVFAWANYLYACGPCNGPKNNRFQVFSARSGQIVNVTRSPKAPVVAPEPGDPLLIDPRRENPLLFMRLDLRDTFLFHELYPPGTRDYERAYHTIDVLDLNGARGREYLPKARAEEYEARCAILGHYVSQKKAGHPPEALARKRAALGRRGHPTVWAEMKRQQSKIAELRALFSEAPEALDW